MQTNLIAIYQLNCFSYDRILNEFTSNVKMQRNRLNNNTKIQNVLTSHSYQQQNRTKVNNLCDYAMLTAFRRTFRWVHRGKYE